MSKTAVFKGAMFTGLAVFIPAVREIWRYVHSVRAAAAAEANARNKIAKIPPEITTEIFAQTFSADPVVVRWDSRNPDQACLVMPAHALDLALTCQKFHRESVGTMRTLLCKDEARPSNLPKTYECLRRIQDVILENGHQAELDVQGFHALKTIVCRAGPVYFVIVPGDKTAIMDFPNSETLIPYRSAVQTQLESQLPLWLRTIATDQQSHVDISLELLLLFSAPLIVREHAWDAGTGYPAMAMWCTCRYHWRSGTISNICSSP
ncbi:hypothetical protein PV04_09984 [Phialophora macrospora]|uniref:Uncharacterized protein n=1 Tax=Phialophora macrospora TaxID=1851006 RepID=A0A0D2F5E8_9EURO|nr:hypothetical protein PV04_09984 [Phialophora macrospora]